MLNAVRPRPAPVLLEQQVGGEAGADQERADKEQNDRRRHRHRRVGKDELAKHGKERWQQEKEWYPVRELAHQVQLVVDGKRELAGLMIEEPVGDFDVQERIRGEQDPERQTERDRNGVGGGPGNSADIQLWTVSDGHGFQVLQFSKSFTAQHKDLFENTVTTEQSQ